jgi:hypothetical protein
MLPTVALDVSGSATIRGSAFNVCAGLATLSNVQIMNTLNVCGQTIFSSNVSFINISASNVFVYTGGTLGVSGSTSLTDLRATTISGSSLYSSGGLTVAGTTTLQATTVGTTLGVTGLTTLGALTATTISGTSLYSSGGLKADGTTTLQATNVATTLGVTGLTTLGNLTATTISGSNIFVSNSLNVSGLLTVSGLTVQRNLSVGGSTTLAGTTINGLLTVCGQTAFRNLCFAQLNGISWAAPVTDKTILTWSQTGNTLKWDTIAYLGLGDWAKNVAVSTISADGNGITGIVSFNNISAIFSATQIGLGPNALRANAQSNIIALGISAGAIGANTTGVGANCIFLGSNPGGSSNLSNSFVVYSQTAGSPLIYGDLARNQVTINATTTTAGVTSASGCTLNVNGSAQAFNFTSPATSSNSIGGVTMSNSILTVGTISGVQNLNGQNLKIDGTIGLIGIGPNMNIGGRSNIAIGNYAGSGYSGTGTSEGGQLIAIGGSAGYGSGGVSNTLIGYHAGEFNYGSFVNAIGYYAGESNKESNVNAIGVYAAWSNAASNVDAIGSYAGFQNVSTGSNLIAIGSNAGQGNRGASNIYIGSAAGNGSSVTNVANAIVIGGGAGVVDGVYTVGTQSIIVGTGTAASGTDSIAIGSFTRVNANANKSIVIGSNALTSGSNSIALGIYAGGGGAGSCNVIAIGSNAGNSTPNVSNAIYLGNNPGYYPTTNNTFLLYSTNNTLPTLQADLSNRRLGVGGAPSYSLDVQVTSAGSNGMRIAQNNTSNVTAGLFLEAGFGGGDVSGNTTLVSFATRGAGGGTVIQSLMSIFEGGEYGLSIKNGNTNSSETFVRVSTASRRMGLGTVSPGATLDVSGTFRVTGGAATLSGVTLNVLNGVKWPSAAGALNTQLVISGTGEASWLAPGTIDSALWAQNPAVANVNISGFDIRNIVSFNTISAIISSTRIGIGPNVLRNNTASSVVAFGCNAGSNVTADSTFNNCVYLGSNPGTSAAAANTFLVYSTTAGIPALQVNTGSNWLGVGKVPTVALDVVGSGQFSGSVTTTGRLFIGGNSASSYSMNIVSSGQRTGFITWSCNTNLNPYIGIGWDQTADGLVISSGPGTNDIATINSFYVSRNTGYVGIGKTSASFPLDVSGQINTNTSVTTPSLAVSASTVLTGTLTLPTIASTTYASKVLSYNSTTGAVTQSTLSLGTLGAADSNTMNANWVTTGGGIVTWNGSVVSGTSRILAIPLNKSMGSDGFFDITQGAWTIQMNGWSAAYFVPNSVPSTYPAANGLIKVFPYQPTSDQVGSNWIFICSTYADVSPMTLKWGPGFITIPSGGVFNSATGGTSWNVLGQATNIALGSNSSITGGTSIVIGSNAASAVAANNVIAIGTNAGSNLPNLNNTIYIGSNAGYRPGTADTLVVHSTSATAPTLQADLANRRLGVGMVPSYALDVAGTIRSSGPVISTISVSGTSAAALTLTTDIATTYFSLTSTATTFTVTFPPAAPPTGTYWVLKNNSTVNYTITPVNGVFNGGTAPSYFLQAGIGVTLAYSGTSAGAPTSYPAYYTF